MTKVQDNGSLKKVFFQDLAEKIEHGPALILLNIYQTKSLSPVPYFTTDDFIAFALENNIFFLCLRREVP